MRKQFAKFQEENYLENFIQSIFDCLDIAKNKMLILGGDGRLGNKNACETIIQMAHANGFKKIIIGKNGLLSTPVASHLVRKYKTIGAIILTASHNAAGENGDFGVKFNDETGGPASEKLTDEIFENSKKIERYHITQQNTPSMEKCGIYDFEGMEIEVVDSVEDYREMMKNIFDFEAIQSLFDSQFTFRFDAMNAVSGIYAKALFVEEFGVDEKWIINGEPDVRFKGVHPDPNQEYAQKLLDAELTANVDLCGACDGDGDRNLIVGRGQFVSPGDSLAVLCANAHLVPEYENGLKGVARSMPTSRAVDKVAETINVPCYVVPTGWKFLAELLEKNKISICGEESFGTGSDHVREKDGIWAIMMWLNVMAKRKLSVGEIIHDHWEKFGKYEYQRHDYQKIKIEDANKIMQEAKKMGCEFSYTNLEGYVSENQGVEIIDEKKEARIIFRLSGTDTDDATIRIYLEKNVKPNGKQNNLDALVQQYREITQIEKITGKTKPDNIT